MKYELSSSAIIEAPKNRREYDLTTLLLHLCGGVHHESHGSWPKPINSHGLFISEIKKQIRWINATPTYTIKEACMLFRPDWADSVVFHEDSFYWFNRETRYACNLREDVPSPATHWGAPEFAITWAKYELGIEPFPEGTADFAPAPNVVKPNENPCLMEVTIAGGVVYGKHEQIKAVQQAILDSEELRRIKGGTTEDGVFRPAIGVVCEGSWCLSEGWVKGVLGADGFFYTDSGAFYTNRYDIEFRPIMSFKEQVSAFLVKQGVEQRAINALIEGLTDNSSPFNIIPKD